MVPWPLRIIHETPLTELWNDHGMVPASPVSDLDSAEDIAVLLGRGSVQFMVAAVGKKPRWIPREETFAFWKGEAKNRLVGKFAYTDQLPPGGGYWAQEWRQAENNTTIVVLTLVS